MVKHAMNNHCVHYSFMSALTSTFCRFYLLLPDILFKGSDLFVAKLSVPHAETCHMRVLFFICIRSILSCFYFLFRLHRSIS